METIEYCFECDKDVDVTIKEETINMDIKGVQFSFIGNIAYCNECGNEVYIAELDEENIKTGNEKYREKLGIIKVSEIENLLRKYNIGKEPLAKLLGWGEKNITRYCNGLMPSKEYSEKLKELINPYKMKELFEKGKDSLTEVATRKLEASIQETLKNFDSERVKALKSEVEYTGKLIINIPKSLHNELVIRAESEMYH